MPSTPFSVEAVTALIRERIAVTRAELGPVSPCTAQRRLQEASCRSSYSHNGRYYTLDELIDFDALACARTAPSVLPDTAR